MSELIFTTSPEFTLLTNKFINVPVILQFEETPLIEIIKEEQLGFTTKIPIFHPDGTYLAVAKGGQLYPTPDGIKAGLKMEHPDKMTVCKLGNQILFEIRRNSAAAIETKAELYSPEGFFVKCSDYDNMGILNNKNEFLGFGGFYMKDCTISGGKIGVLIRKDGSVSIGCN